MNTAEIRERFLAYFEKQGHQRVNSSSLVPGNDPTLLFTNAGMVQFKDVFLGAEKRNYSRATTSQRCVRAGGKHNDLENVGYTARHHTFFEMLGNFSFGDYFKKEAIHFAWDFLTNELGLPKEKLWVTVFEEDDEAADIWLNDIGVSPNSFSRIGAKDNFWSMGDTGPCGPCTEIFYDHGESVAGGPPGTPEEDGDRYIEIWNLVFMQYDRQESGELKPLPKPSVDTGMGLERVAAVMQDLHNNYDIDLFNSITKQICEVIGTNDQSHHSVRVLADHIRSSAFLITDEVLPSNEGKGYVLRRIIRRAIRHGYQLGGEVPFFYKIVDSLAGQMGEAFPELLKNQSRIEEALKKEELRFSETLDQGLKIFGQKTNDFSEKEVSGDLAFLLYDTYGFPIDLTADVAREKGLTVDMKGFEVAMEAQRERARSSSQFSGDSVVQFDLNQATEFLGYQETSSEAKILAIAEQGKLVNEADNDGEFLIVLDKTPFYAEGGGQIGDTGTLSTNDAEFRVVDTKKQAGDIFVHRGTLLSGQLKLGEIVKASVEDNTRLATARNHSGTHLLHAALIEVLGDHVQQKGSLVDADKLRFDFSHDGPVSHEQIQKIEQLVNTEILLNREVETQLMAIDDAKAAGAAALFGEKYGETVRVVSMGSFSMELCGGTHVSRTGDVGLIKITSESGVASGVRRLEAVTGLGAHDFVTEQLNVLNQVNTNLRTNSETVLGRITQLQDQLKQSQQDNLALQKTIATGGAAGSSDLDSKLIDVGDVKLLCADMQSVDKSILRDTIDKYKSQYDNAIVLLATRSDEKVPLVAGVSKTISKNYPAGKLIQHVTGLFGGRGGGRPDMAEGGIANADDVEKCLSEAKKWVEQQS